MKKVSQDLNSTQPLALVQLAKVDCRGRNYWQDLE